MENNPPKVSIIVSTFNRARLLKRALLSIQAQTFKDWECIIVDDGSTDKTPQLAASFAKKDKRFIYIRRPNNFGKDTRPKNDGCRASQGEYIAYLDDDNEFLPNHLEVLVSEIELAGVDLVYGDMRIIDPKDPTNPIRAIAYDFDHQLLINRCYIDTSEVLHKRDAVFAVGGWDETLPRFVDWNLWVRMMKAGMRMKRIPVYITKYWMTPHNTAEKYPVQTWSDPKTGLLMFNPTFFSPSACPVYGPWLGNDRQEELQPKVAIFMLTHDRLEYTKRTLESLKSSTHYPIDLFIFDNDSKDDTLKYLNQYMKDNLGGNVKIQWLEESPENVGISHASNRALDAIKEYGNYQIIGKLDNDVEFLTKSWLEDFINLWQTNHMFYMGPYPEGLVDHPGGMARIGHSTIGSQWVEIVSHLSGFCCFVDAKAYDGFRFQDQFLHGSQDVEASKAFRAKDYQPTIIPNHRVQHMDSTEGQRKKFKGYFKRRIKEKQQTYVSATT